MDAIDVGQKIVSLRKQKGMTQKQLAEMLFITDKAVSKWERGVNFPDISIMKPLADVLEISVSELLGLEQSTSEEVINKVAEISIEEKKNIKRGLKIRAWINIIIGIFLWITQVVASWIFHNMGLDGGVPGMLTVGMMGWTGIIMGNAIYTLGHLRKM